MDIDISSNPEKDSFAFVYFGMLYASIVVLLGKLSLPVAADESNSVLQQYSTVNSFLTENDVNIHKTHKTFLGD